MKKIFVMLLAALFFVPAAARAADAVKPMVLFDFEKADELKCFQLDGPAKDKMKAELVADNKSTGKTCLKVTYTDEGWGDVQFFTFAGDWSKYNMLKVDVFNPTKTMIGLDFQGVDKDGGISKEAYFGNPDARVRVTSMVKPGKNSLVFPFKFDKPFDLKAVKMFSFSTMSRPAGLILYFDNVRLEKGDLKEYDE